MSQNGKGSRPRPLSVPYKEYEKRWNQIFKKKINKAKKAV